MLVINKYFDKSHKTKLSIFWYRIRMILKLLKSSSFILIDVKFDNRGRPDEVDICRALIDTKGTVRFIRESLDLIEEMESTVTTAKNILEQ